MIRKEVAFHLLTAGYTPELPDSPETIWWHPKLKCTVKIRRGGYVVIWYTHHPKYYMWDSQMREFINR